MVRPFLAMAWKLERNNKLVDGQKAIQNAHLKQPKTPRNSGSNPNQINFHRMEIYRCKSKD
jgi:hypothetical protein